MPVWHAAAALVRDAQTRPSRPCPRQHAGDYEGRSMQLLTRSGAFVSILAAGHVLGTAAVLWRLLKGCVRGGAQCIGCIGSSMSDGPGALAGAGRLHAPPSPSCCAPCALQRVRRHGLAAM